jgi:hypothetical protein
MDLTLILTGMLPGIIIVSAALTAAASLFLLWLYRRAVLRSMGARATASARSQMSYNKAGRRSDSEVPLVIPDKSKDQYDSADSAKSNYIQAKYSLRKVVLIYMIGGLAYAVILALPWILFADGGFVLTRFLWLVFCYGWPTVIALILIAAITKKDRLIIAGAYFAILIFTGMIALVRNPILSVGQLIFFWLFANGPGTILFLTFLHHKIRAVGPLVLAFMTAGVAGASVTIQAAGSDNRLLEIIVNIGGTVGIGAIGTFILMHLIGFALFGIFGFFLLRRLGRSYQQKRMSDQSITLDAMWLMFGVVQSITLAFEGWAWIFAGLAAFLVYKLVVKAGLGLCFRNDRSNSEAPLLLLLRVFSLGHRSERLFNSMSKLWLRSGSIGLISGPDLVTTTVEPHEFLDFMGGHLSRQFVQNQSDLNKRLDQIDTQPDPDGRFRVNEFFCHADTWQMTMQQLARMSNVVLMDLRSFSKTNQGCLYELEQLLATIPLERVMFVIDNTTDKPFLEQTFKILWKNIPENSPNQQKSSSELQLLRVSSHATKNTRKLLQTLFSATDINKFHPHLRYFVA